ncbi:hypothetical protein FPFC_061010 [Fructobacillus pseudoficulneus]|uniref:Uncharacterized protein n=1 Tax=Fructobacillus pseudoficulneus TaxID=220714 RepID=A0A3F3H4Y6_9LACO|nr:hypothetical protein [Fructobacillus pseudoficulneus]GAP03378.1 hypothetical protein FPFC_061010 [Fructobacillus pseudoficulneus]SEH43634.1 hypothetical protein SAMN05660469_1051 [Fructobacillus pseudoficulneus]
MNSEKRYFELTDNEKIVLNSIEEITNYLKDDTDNPVSLSFYLWKMGIDDPQAKEKLIQATFKLIINSKNPLNLTKEDFSYEFQKISELFETNNTNIIIYVLTWIGLNISPVAYAIAQNIE